MAVVRVLRVSGVGAWSAVPAGVVVGDVEAEFLEFGEEQPPGLLHAADLHHPRGGAGQDRAETPSAAWRRSYPPQRCRTRLRHRQGPADKTIARHWLRLMGTTPRMLFTTAAAAQFAAAYHAPTCVLAMQQLNRQVTDPAAYVNDLSVPAGAWAEVGATATLDGCALTWSDPFSDPSAPAPGPRLGFWTLTQLDGEGWQITHYEPC